MHMFDVFFCGGCVPSSMYVYVYMVFELRHDAVDHAMHGCTQQHRGERCLQGKRKCIRAQFAMRHDAWSDCDSTSGMNMCQSW